LQVEVSEQRPGTTLKLEVARDGKNTTLPVTLEAMGSRDGNRENAEATQEKPRWGLGLSDLTPDVRQQIQAPSDVKGAVIERVQAGSPADQAGLQAGDVVISVDRHATPNAADVQQALSRVPKDQDTLLLVWSNGGNSFRVLHPSGGA